MSWTASAQPVDGGDPAAWGPKEQAQNHLAIGQNSTYLYLDGSDLKISAGNIGLYNGSQYYNLINSAAAVISVAGKTASCWAKIQVSVVAGNVVIEIDSVAGETNPAVLPTSWTGAYDGAKGAHYITGTKRATALVWINAGGVVEGIVNETPGSDGYYGYSLSDDALDQQYYFGRNNGRDSNAANARPVKFYTTAIDLPLPDDTYDKVICVTATGKTITLPLSTNVPEGQRIIVIMNYTGTGATAIARQGADTVNGATSKNIFEQYSIAIIQTNGNGVWVLNPVAGDDAFKAFTPGWTNLNAGNGTNNGYYKIVGNICFFRVYVLLGASGASVGTAPTMTMPFTARAVNKTGHCIIAHGAGDAGGGSNYHFVMTADGILKIDNVGSTYPTISTVTATLPNTWAAGNFFEIQGFYEIAT